MSLRSIQIAKESRLLLGAWVVVMIAGVLSLVPVATSLPGVNIHGILESIVPVGAIFGIPLLATLALGSEFQYRTLPMLLAQPVDRREIWRDKMSVSAAAVATAAAVYAFALHALHPGNTAEWVMAIAVAVVATAAAPFYLFVARSMIGGLVLNLSGFFVVTLLLDYFGYLVQTTARTGYQPYERHLRELPAWFIVTAALLYAGYAGLMAWLGRRGLLRFQSVEGMQAGEAMLPGARFFPRFLANIFRCRAQGRILNLLRREFHLLRIVWALGALCAAVWTAIALFGLLPTPYTERFVMLVGVAAVGNVVIAVLAGTISLGEEKTWGTHAWHLTLPVSASAQWAVKLLVALFTSAVCATLVPLAILTIGGALGGPRHGLPANAVPWNFVGEALIVTLAAFWSACLVKGTVRATIWVIPAGLTVVGSVLFASWISSLGSSTSGDWFSRTTWYSRALAWVVAAIGPMSIGSKGALLFGYAFGINTKYILIAVISGIALIQTHRIFAARREETTGTIVRALVPVALATMLCVLGMEGLQLTAIQVFRQQSQFIEETHQAIIATMRAADERPRLERLTWDQLAKNPSLTGGTRRWLRDASITVLQDSPELADLHYVRMAPSTMSALIPSAAAGPIAGYTAIVQLGNHSECSLKFNRATPAARGRFGGWIRGTCE